MIDVQQRLSALAGDWPFLVRWALYDFATGIHYGERVDEVQWTASTRKVAVMMCVLSEVSAGRVDLQREFTYTPELAERVQSGTFRYMSTGFTFTLRDALTQMIVSSDNVCTQLVFQALGGTAQEQLQTVNDYCQNSGLHQTVHRHVFPDTSRIPWHHTDEPMTTSSVSDQVRLLRGIVEGCSSPEGSSALAVSQELCRFSLAVLSLGETSNGFARLLPDEVRVAQKGGRGIRGRTEVGVIFDNRDTPALALAVYTDWVQTRLRDGRPGNELALDMISSFGRGAWELLVNRSHIPDEVQFYGRRG